MLNSNEVRPDFSSVMRHKAALPGAKPKEMLSVERDGAQTLVRVNSSSHSLIQTCGRKSQYSLSQGWKPKAVQPPLEFGTAIHKAMEVFYSWQGERTFPIDFDQVAPLLADGRPAPEPHFLYEALVAFVKAMAPLRILPDDDKRSIPSGIWVLSHYFRTYLNDIYRVHVDEHGPVVERSFRVPFYEGAKLKVELFGQIDFVLKNMVTGQILPGDHKTSSQMGSDFFNRCKPNHQYTGYLIGAHQALGISDEHFLINGIQSSSAPKMKNDGSPRANPKGPPTFTRQITRRTPEDFKEYRDSLMDAVHNYLRWDETGTFPLGVVDACASWGGCHFLEVCSAPNELRDNILSAKFHRRTT